MRKVFSVALMAAMICLVGMARDASALVTFDLIWVSTTGTGAGVGTDTIAADIGDNLVLEIRMTTTQTLGGHFVSLAFDTDLGNELNLLGFADWTGVTLGSMASLTTYIPNFGGPSGPVESTGATGGGIDTYESGQAAGTLFLPVGTYVIGTAGFSVNGATNPQGDGDDVFIGLFNTGVDDILGNNFLPIAASGLVFNGAAVTSAVIPEPGTVSLLGLGLVGLILAGRRSRRS